ncbi:uncharacterized protein EAF01_008029 [Botrytis porri]|uniref:uncharacterized protein n=1 Tax=Botrytis porri TaxID=87229 RepID=UPI0018FFD77E|nr:uncharacterized protein EAF01_008029 [Botrytis porri]KAF7900727.1 hypothetical protein EAF01_008029 [Botrytis porri]
MSLLLPGETLKEAEKRLGFQLDKRPPKMYNATQQEMTARGRAWLASEPLWSKESRMGPVPSWTGVKIMGEGGNGTAGKWRLTYRQPPEGTPGRLPFERIVVKQQGGGWGDMREEAQMYELLRHTKSQHLVKMFRRIYEDRGLNTVYADRTGPVTRIYLEDCEKGDLSNWIFMHFHDRIIFEEHEIWDAFHCIARGLYAMHSGHEDLNEDRWDRDEIVHFDFKGQNVFMGAGPRDDEHRGSNIMKIGDYGHSAEVPLEQDLLYNFKHRRLGTERYKLPEQLRTRERPLERPWMDPMPKSMREAGDGNILNNIRYGTHSNVWQLGVIIWQMIHTTEWCQDGNSSLAYSTIADLEWGGDEKRRGPGPPGRFRLKLYKVANIWLGLNEEVGGVHTLATQDDIDFYNGAYDALPSESEGEIDPDQPEEQKPMAKLKRDIENRAREQVRRDRLYSDTLHKLVMDCLIVQGEARIHVEDLYRRTLQFKKLYQDLATPMLPAPYSPEPELGELPIPWNDITTRPGGGLGLPVREEEESYPLDLFELFYATVEHEKVEEVLKFVRENPIDAMSEYETVHTRALVMRNRVSVNNYLSMSMRAQGQRTKPQYKVPAPFPENWKHAVLQDNSRRGGLFPGVPQTSLTQQQQGVLRVMNPSRGPPLSTVREGDERPTHNQGSPRGPKDFSYEADATPSYLRQFESTPEHMKPVSQRETPEHMRGPTRSAGYAGGDLGGFEDFGDYERIKITSASGEGRGRRHFGSHTSMESIDIGGGIVIGGARGRRASRKKSSEKVVWPEFPLGLQKEVDKPFLLRALEIPELKGSILFCTVIEFKGQEEVLKGIVYLTGLLNGTTIYDMKEMLAERETGIPVKSMKLMGNDLLSVFREFEDEEERRAIHGIELFLYDLRTDEKEEDV